MRLAVAVTPHVAISLILPALNERDAIVRAISEADSALRKVATDYEIIVVDDGSTDDMASLVNQAAIANPAVRLVRHRVNQGYGAALRSGFAAATKDLVVFTDADCQFDLSELDRFVLLADRYDIVCGYRIDRKDTALRRLYSKVYNQLVRVLLQTGVRDVDCALKMFHREAVQSLKITCSGFLVNSEILTQARQQGYRVVEVGVSHRPRVDGSSTVSIVHIPRVLKSLAKYWWNEVQFPAASCSAASLQNQPKTEAHAILNHRQASWLQLALLFVAAAFLFTNLGYPLIDRDETRYAEIPREMLATGNWVLPQLNFETYYDKPPLLYWLCAISFKVFGVNETAARLVPALAALATIASTMWFGSRAFNKQIGLLAGIVLFLSVGFAFSSRYLLLDGVLTLFVSLSLFSAYEAVRKPRIALGWWILSGAACGLAFLTKGPLAIVLWLPPVLAFTWLSEGYAKPRIWHYAMTIGIAGLITAPWLWAVHQQDSQFLAEFFYKHNLRRFAGDFHSRPIWYFIPVVLVAGHPWSFLTIPYLTFLFSQRNDNRFQRPPIVGYLLLWSAWCFVFFSLSRCKLPTYLLPAAPPMALMIGHYLQRVLYGSSRDQHWMARFWSPRAATIASCTGGIAFVGYLLIGGLESGFSIYAWAILWTVLLCSAVMLVIDRHQLEWSWPSAAACAFLLVVMVMHQAVPAYSRAQTLIGYKTPFLKLLEENPRAPIATIRHEFSEVPFYLDRSDIPHFHNLYEKDLEDLVRHHPRTMLVIESRISDNELLQQLPSGTRIRILSERGSARLIEVQPARHTMTVATTSIKNAQK